jgi:hypothetical protein
MFGNEVVPRRRVLLDGHLVLRLVAFNLTMKWRIDGESCVGVSSCWRRRNTTLDRQSMSHGLRLRYLRRHLRSTPIRRTYHGLQPLLALLVLIDDRVLQQSVSIRSRRVAGSIRSEWVSNASRNTFLFSRKLPRPVACNSRYLNIAFQPRQTGPLKSGLFRGGK